MLILSEANLVELMSLTITAACIIHNLAIKNNDLLPIDGIDQDLNISTEEINQDFGVSVAVIQRNDVDKRNKLVVRFDED